MPNMSKEEQLLEAGMKGDSARVTRLLTPRLGGLVKGADVDAVNDRGYTALHLAVEGGHQETVHVLLAAGANVNRQASDGRTILMSSAWFRHKEIVDALLAVGADVNQQDQHGNTALMFAAKEEWHDLREIVRVLLAAGAQVNIQNRAGETALMLASESGGSDIVDALLAAGADVNAQDRSGRTALMYARSKDTADALLTAGANVNVRSKSGDTALIYAARSRYRWGWEIVEPLLAAGADANARNFAGETALGFACKDKREDMVSLLIASGARASAADVIQALRNNNCEMALLLIENADGIEGSQADEDTPLHRAAFCGDDRVVKELIRKGAKVNAEIVTTTAQGYDRGTTPLHVAAAEGHRDVVAVLVENGADVNAGLGYGSHWEMSTTGATPLHLAAAHDHAAVVGLLVENGAKVETTDTNGHTALHYAARLNSENAGRKLLELGANPYAKDGFGHIPANVAPLGTLERLLRAAMQRPAAKRSSPRRPKSDTWALIEERGLRPLGNKRRLTQAAESDAYNVRMLLFPTRQNAQGYFDAFVAYGRNNPPPFLIEVTLLYIPRNIYDDKYAVVIPNEQAETRPGYLEWAMGVMRESAEAVRPRVSTDHKYAELHKYVDAVHCWDLLLPGGFSLSSEEAERLLRDTPHEDYPALPMSG
jgi:uncharacterized protein